MATFPPTVSPQGSADGPPSGGSPSGPGGGGGSPALKLAMLGQLIQGLATQFPQGQAGIKMMLDGLRQIQSSAASQSAPQQPTTPPR